MVERTPAAKPTTTAKPATKTTTTLAKNLPQGKTTKEDYECPVCMEFCAQPVVTPCKHFFCLPCQKNLMNKGMTCPLCRSVFDKLFVPVVDHDLQAKIAIQFEKEFEEAKTDQIAQGVWRGTKIPMRFAYGNTHEDVINPKQAGNTEHKNSHRWGMFLTLNNDTASTNKYIKSVTYRLHPSFTPNVIKLDKAPFLISRIGWGYFDIIVDVEF